MSNKTPRNIAFLLFDLGLIIWMYLENADIVFLGSVMGGPIILIAGLLLYAKGRLVYRASLFGGIVPYIIRALLLVTALIHYYYYQRSILFITNGVRKDGLEIFLDVSYLIIFSIAFFVEVFLLILNLLDLFNKKTSTLEAIRQPVWFRLVTSFYVISMIVMGYIAINFY